MRILGLLAVLFSISVHAADVRFFTEHRRLVPGQQGAVFIENTGGETVRDAKVEIAIPSRLAFFGDVSAVDGDWTCVTAERKATCTTSSLPPGSFSGIFFDVRPKHADGGHHAITATLTAQNLSHITPIVFDLVSTTAFTVTTASDFGEGSLRSIIELINEHAFCGTDVPCAVTFAHPMTIAPATPLPPIRKCNVRISGGPGIEFPNEPKPVVISGENATYGNGLEVRATCPAGVQGVTLHGLVINSWPWNGVYFEAPAPHEAGGHLIDRSYIGLNAMGTEARPNRGRGVVIDSPYEAVAIINSVISGNARSGVAVFRSRWVRVQSKIGISREHEPLGNGASGVFSHGAPVEVTGSIIAYNAHAGVSLVPGTRGLVSESEIFANGGLPVDWALDERTLPDDESDRILNAPQIVDAFYDAATNATVVRGTVRLRAGVFGTEVFELAAYVAHGTRGDVAERIPHGPFRLTAPADGNASDVPFEVRLAGDYRGRFISLQNFAMTPLQSIRTRSVSSEISEGVLVR